jgi:hypothetical protein
MNTNKESISMKKNHFSFLKGFAHIEIWPNTDYKHYLPKGNVTQRLNRHWVNTGKYLYTSVDLYERSKVVEK